MSLAFQGALRRIAVSYIGDSITLGTGNTNTVAQTGFRGALSNNIRVRFGTNKMVPRFMGWDSSGDSAPRMIGTAGQRIDELNANPYATVQLPAFRSDIIFLHAGTNNMTQLNSGLWPFSVAQAVTDMSGLLDTIRTYCPSAHVFLAEIIPNTNAPVDTLIDQFNTAMLTMVAARSDVAYIHIVDQNGAFKANASWATDYMADATHPNEAGYAVMASTWYTAFTSVF